METSEHLREVQRRGAGRRLEGRRGRLLRCRHSWWHGHRRYEGGHLHWRRCWGGR